MWFMQDGSQAPAHNAGIVVDYLEQTFPYRWIGTNSPHLCWPARSPDWNPLDYFFGDTLKMLSIINSTTQKLNYKMPSWKLAIASLVFKLRMQLKISNAD